MKGREWKSVRAARVGEAGEGFLHVAGGVVSSPCVSYGDTNQGAFELCECVWEHSMVLSIDRGVAVSWRHGVLRVEGNEPWFVRGTWTPRGSSSTRGPTLLFDVLDLDHLGSRKVWILLDKERKRLAASPALMSSQSPCLYGLPVHGNLSCTLRAEVPIEV